MWQRERVITQYIWKPLKSTEKKIKKYEMWQGNRMITQYIYENVKKKYGKR